MPKHSIVYRIEDKNGNGVYRGDVNLYDYKDFDKFSKEQKHPMPQDDSKLKQSIPKEGKRYSIFSEGEIICHKWLSNFLFGFSSIEQLKSWFYDDSVLQWLDKQGFSLIVYKGVAYHGNSQAIIRKVSKKIQKISLTSILTI